MNTERWMEEIDSEKPLSLINIPGTHNSCTSHIPLHYFCRCQIASVAEQLRLGVRCLDLRVEHSGGRLKLVHSVVDCIDSAFSVKKLWLEDVIADCAEFLRLNPSETVIMNFQTDDGKDKNTAGDVLFGKYIYPQKELWYLENRIPFLYECRGKLVLVVRSPRGTENRFNDKNCGIDFFGSDTDENGVRRIRSIENGDILFTAYIQDDYLVPPSRKWRDFVLPCLNEKQADANTLLINYLSANNGFCSPKITAGYVNPRFLRYDLKKGAHYGIICSDYITKDITLKIIESNNMN